MLSFEAISGRFIVGRDRLSFQTGEAIARAHGKVYNIADMFACFVEFEDLQIHEIDLDQAELKAIRGGLDSKRCFEGICDKKIYLVSLQQGQCFMYIVNIADCWRSFLVDTITSDGPVGNQSQICDNR